MTFNDDIDNEPHLPATSGNRTSMRDWTQAFVLPVELFFLGIVAALVLPLALKLIGLQGYFALTVYLLLLAGVIVGVVSTIWAQFCGIQFDTEKDRLRFPSYALRRSVPLSEITDANCEFGHGIYTLIAALANGLNNTSRHRAKRMYMVNLSGEFGSRQVRFITKRRRDQFLSLLRRVAPHVRITRSAAWN